MGGKDEHRVNEGMFGHLLHIVQNLLHLVAGQDQAVPKGTLFLVCQSATFDNLLDFLPSLERQLLFSLGIFYAFGRSRTGEIVLCDCPIPNPTEGCNFFFHLKRGPPRTISSAPLIQVARGPRRPIG